MDKKHDLSAGWMSSSLDMDGERHAFRLRIDDSVEQPYCQNCSSGYRALCGRIAKEMTPPLAGDPRLEQFLELPKCEACETLLPSQRED